MTNRSEVALKAWATRRANATAKKRSEAAHRAWSTRRSKAISPRSAAFKAWDTRRAMTNSTA